MTRCLYSFIDFRHWVRAGSHDDYPFQRCGSSMLIILIMRATVSEACVRATAGCASYLLILALAVLKQKLVSM